MSEDLILEMKNITKTFPGVRALSNVNLKVKRGEIHSLCGENGAGKSTLMNVLSGVYPYKSYDGDIILNNELCRFHNIKQSELKGIVIIHQELALIPLLSIAENMFLGNEQVKGAKIIDWRKTQVKAKEMLDRVGLKNEDVNQQVNTIGVGKQQLVEIAKALAKNVSLLILDEPTASLNDEESNNLLNIILQLKEEGVTSIIISHKLRELTKVSDRITVIRDGEVIKTLDKKTDEFSEPVIIKSMVGRELTQIYPKRENCPIGKEIFKVANWNVYHPEDNTIKIIDNVNFHVNSGEVVGLVGLMGAGRTELAMSIFGKSYGQKISGNIYIHGKKIKIETVKDAINNKIAYTSEDRKTYGLVLTDSIMHNMSMASLRNLFSSKNGVLDKNKEVKETTLNSKKFGIKAPSINSKADTLSGGNQQKVVLAKWIMAAPDILILDEPTRGIDVGAKHEIYQLINELAENGKAVIVISSEMPEAIGVSDRVYVLNEGRIIGELEGSEMSPEAIMTQIIRDTKKRGRD
ncbi:MAG: sugar ABC transporter ATP-binding protein [Spirochaetaceae bacterium]|nr:sugar ABC transporter ATP-binding protein [Spirochaetaceae bacterium]